MIRRQVLPASGMFVDDTCQIKDGKLYGLTLLLTTPETWAFKQRAAVQVIIDVSPAVHSLAPILSTTQSCSLSLVLSLSGMFDK